MFTQVTLPWSMPCSLAKAGNIWRCPSPGGAPMRLALEVLGPGDRRVLAAPDVERRLVEDHADDLDLAAAADGGDDHGAVGEADVRAAGVHLGDRVARALGVLELDVEAAGPCSSPCRARPSRRHGRRRRTSSARRRPSPAPGRPRGQRRRGARRRARRTASEDTRHDGSPCQSEISAHGAIQRAARTTAP